MALPEFKRNPYPILPILERLKRDPSEYVRRSVANNLNDISKDHPALALELATGWYGDHADTDWIVKHACRTLLKQGDARAMTLFGYTAPKTVMLKDFCVAESVSIGNRLPFSFRLASKKGPLGKLRVEYAVHFRLKNGEHGRKVFKISESEIVEREKSIEKSHSFKPITIRTYYPGEHKIEVIVNGVGLASRIFVLNK